MQRCLSHLQRPGNNCENRFLWLLSYFQLDSSQPCEGQVAQCSSEPPTHIGARRLPEQKATFCEDGRFVVDPVVYRTGAPWGAVLFTIYTANFTYNTTKHLLQKFSDDSVVLSLNGSGDKNEYRELNQNSVARCQQKCPQINAGKYKELVVDLRQNKATPPSPLNIQGTDIESVNSFKYLDVHLNNNSPPPPRRLSMTPSLRQPSPMTRSAGGATSQQRRRKDWIDWWRKPAQSSAAIFSITY